MTESSLFSNSEIGPPQIVHLSPSGSNAADAETLRQFSIFADLDVEQRERLASQMQPLTVPARTILLAAGQPGHAVYFLLEGTVKIGLERPAGPRTQKLPEDTDSVSREAPVVPAGTGAQVMLSLCGSGAVLGEISVLDGLGHSANVITRETCCLLWMDKDVFIQSLQDFPELSLALLRECCARLRSATYQLHAYATLDAAGRIAHALLRLCERFGTSTLEGGRLDIGLTQPEIADLVGLTRVRVSTVLAQFKKSGWISQEPDGKFLFHDMARLAIVSHFKPHLH